jgi:hypothetical protein
MTKNFHYVFCATFSIILYKLLLFIWILCYCFPCLFTELTGCSITFHYICMKDKQGENKQHPQQQDNRQYNINNECMQYCCASMNEKDDNLCTTRYQQ